MRSLGIKSGLRQLSNDFSVERWSERFQTKKSQRFDLNFPLTLAHHNLASNMPVSKHGARSLFYCSTCLSRVQTARASFQAPIRSLSNSASSYQNVQKTSTSPSSDQSAPLDPKLVHTRSQERRLIRDLKQYPIGSRRRRVALSISPGLPFEQLPYQCFQEARNILAENRQEKVNEIEVQRGRIARLVEQDPSVSGGEAAKQIRLTSMRAQLEKLKIMADINDPLVKKKFEDGLGIFRNAVLTNKLLTWSRRHEQAHLPLSCR